MDAFFAEVLNHLLKKSILDTHMRILAVCGGATDRDVLWWAGFRNVVISNLDSRMKGNEFAPFEWNFQDAEHLTLEDNSFDFCVVHSGLHHCYSPHRALLEMYRIARKGILVFEPYDNFVTRLGIRLNISQEFEHAAVFYNECAYGGVKNSWIPNHVYRWTEKEIIKTINSFAPTRKHHFFFFHKWRIPWSQLKGRKNAAILLLTAFAVPFLKIIGIVFPKQTNNFAAVVLKPELLRELHPWLIWEGNNIKLNQSWLTERYRKQTG